MRRICVIITLLIMYASVIPIPTYAKMISNVSARNAVLMEQQSGRVLYGKAEHEPQKIASITKIMTALLAAESGKMKEMVSVSNEAVSRRLSNLFKAWTESKIRGFSIWTHA